MFKEITKPTSDNRTDIKMRIINRSLIKQTTQGYEFCHRSMQEYFVAKGLCRRLTESPKEAETFLSEKDLTLETIDFAGQILQEPTDESKKAKQHLADMITSTRKKSPDDRKIARLGASAINIYFAAGNRLPDIADWTHLVLDNARLPEADFSNKNLTGTSFKNANLDNVNFTGTNLTNCDLSGVQFDETNEIQTMKVLPTDTTHLYVIYVGGKLRKWNINDNNHMDETKEDLDASLNMGASNFGLVFFEKDQIHFTRKTEKYLKLCGGVHHDKAVVVLDIKGNNMLFTDNKQISFYNLSTQSHIFKKHSELSENIVVNGVIVDDSSFLLFNDTAGLRLLSKNENNEIDEKKLLAEPKEHFEGITTMSVQLISSAEKSFRIGIGYKNGNLDLYDFNLSEQKKSEDTYYLKKFASHNCGQYVKNTCFLPADQIAYTGLDGVIHVLWFNKLGDLQTEKQWRLAIQCEKAIVNGVTPETQKNKLIEYGGLEQ
jgi:uncharacterized protein YjbI with pentapeptide repeats